VTSTYELQKNGIEKKVKIRG